MNDPQANRDAAFDRLDRVNRRLAVGSVLGAGVLLVLVATDSHLSHHPSAPTAAPAAQAHPRSDEAPAANGSDEGSAASAESSESSSPAPAAAAAAAPAPASSASSSAATPAPVVSGGS